MRMKPSLDLDDAQALAGACLAAAGDLGAAVSVAVVDEAGGLLWFQRLGGARGYSADLAIRKARTAAAIGVPTAVLEQLVRERPMPGQDMLAVAGGAPVMLEGQCAGAVGVSGGPAEVDEAIVEAGLAALA